MVCIRCRWLIVPLLLAACSGKSPYGGTTTPQVKLGNPYSVDGKTYYPEYDPTYDKIGMGSWYGPGFHGRKTASGEVFNEKDLTAAHPTLPMPSLVRVTNLKNGKSVIVRINDRGPFKENRIIDLSRGSAERIGLKVTTQVRVQYLKKDTDEYLDALKKGQVIDMFAYNQQVENARNDLIIQSTEPTQAQLIEANNIAEQPGQAVSDAAPVMSVSAGNLDKPSGAIEQKALPAPKAVVKEVWADDNKTLPEPPKQDKPVTVSEKGGAVQLHDAAEEEAHIAQEETPEPSPKAEKPVASPVAAPAAGGNYIIQAGSFASEENARKLGKSISGAARVAVDKVDMNGKTWWRVRVGPFSGKGEADSVLDKVRSSGAPDARIVRL